ncbi:MAG: hypothetical protein P4L73_13495 [Caulobacteraceae bacterium]|nr:hypothetical protein [Caulobacteraceae bacterium]
MARKPPNARSNLTKVAARAGAQGYEQRRAERAWRGWYKTKRWTRIRADQLEREPWCWRCLEAGIRTWATVCNHTIPHRGDPVRFWTGPFDSLCKHHHDSDQQRAELEADRRF